MITGSRIVRTYPVLSPGKHRPAQDVSLEVPYIDPKLLSYLNQVFPDSVNLASQRGLEAALGIRAVIEHLHGLHQEQETRLPDVLRIQA